MAVHNNLTRKSFDAFLWQFGGTIFKALVQLVVLMLLARIISKSDFGIMQSSIIVIGLAQLLSQMGVGPSLVQKLNITNLHIRAGLTISLFLSTTSFLTVYFSSNLIAGFFKMPDLSDALKVVSIIFIIEGVATVSQSLLLREMKQKKLVIIDIISYSLGYAVIAVVLALNNYGYWALIGGQIGQSIIKLVLSFYIKPHSLNPFFGKREHKELLYFGGGFTLAKLFNYFGTQGDKVITGRYLGADLLGVYSNAYSLMIQPASLLGTSIDKVLFPAMSARQNNVNKLTKGFLKGAQTITFISIPISIILILSAKPLINVILGSKWNDVVFPFQILASILVFRIGYKMGDNLCRATGNVYRRAWIQLLYAIIMIGSTYIGAKNNGVIGVAYGAAISITINYIMMINLGLKILQLSWKEYLKETFFKYIIESIIGVLLFYIIFKLTGLYVKSDLLLLIISFSLFGILVMALIFSFPEKLKFLEILPIKIGKIK